MQGPFARPDASPLSRYWRCDQHACKHWMNVLQGAKWLEGVTRFRSLTPARLWHVISRYVTLTCPNRQAVASGLGAEGPKIAQFVMDSLRTLEAGEGRRMNATLSLTGQCEVDGTSLRPLYINNRSLHWSEEISDWVRSSKHFIPCFYHLMFAVSSLLECISLRIPLPCSDGKSEKKPPMVFSQMFGLLPSSAVLRTQEETIAHLLPDALALGWLRGTWRRRTLASLPTGPHLVAAWVMSCHGVSERCPKNRISEAVATTLHCIW